MEVVGMNFESRPVDKISMIYNPMSQLIMKMYSQEERPNIVCGLCTGKFIKLSHEK